MIYVLAPAQMRAADAAAVARVGDDALMQRAGARIADRARAMLRPGGRVVAFAGPGNNGGDAYAALALLGCDYPCMIYADPLERPSAARAAAQQRAAAAGVASAALPTDDDAARGALAGADLALDGLFGTGARLPVGERYAASTRALDARRVPVLAIDVPSGIDAADGTVDPNAVRASATVTLAALKPGLLLDPARDRVGALWCARIGIDDATLAAASGGYAALGARAFRALLPRRAPESDKRASGAPLVIAGSRQFPGAAVLCARGAARSGAGYVTVATPRSAAATLRAHLIEQVVVELDDAAEPEAIVAELLDLAGHAGAVAIGPGIGLDARTGTIVRTFLQRVPVPCAIDASALFHLAKQLEILRGKPCVLTPHAGEFARLSGEGTLTPATRVARLRAFVARTGITTLLKGRTTLIDDGTTLHFNTTGTNALATAGTGDVLSGIIATLLSQGLPPVDAARAGAFWHGLAGAAAQTRRPVGTIAGDVADALGTALPVPPPDDWEALRIFGA